MASIILRGRFAAQAKQMLEPRAWYIGFRCVGCDHSFALLDDPTNSGAIEVTGDAVIHASCPNCATEADYVPASAVLFHATVGGSTVLPEVQTIPGGPQGGAREVRPR